MEEPSKEQRIWQVVLAIPKGRVAGYGQVAAMAGRARGTEGHQRKPTDIDRVHACAHVVRQLQNY